MDLKRIRQDFPILRNSADHKPYVYFDNACQSLSPQVVIDAIEDYYVNMSACSGRSMHRLAARGHPKLRPGTRPSGQIPQRGAKGRDHLHPQHHRRDQPGGRIRSSCTRGMWC